MPLRPDMFVPAPNPVPELRGLALHVFGARGRGMGPVALAAASLGAHVDACDEFGAFGSPTLDRAGIHLAAGHDPSHVVGRHLVIPSTATLEQPEVVAARDRGVLHHRSDLLDALLRAPASVAVTGSHGKGTVAALAGMALAQLGEDPMLVLGVNIGAIDGPFRAGLGPVVAEADDADGSIARVAASVSVITNSWADHPSFGRSRQEVAADIARHAARVPSNGRIVIGRGRNLGPIVREATAPVWRLGRDVDAETVSVDADGRVVRLRDHEGEIVDARVRIHGGGLTDNVGLAFAVLRALDVPARAAADALGALDRLERRVEPVALAGGVRIFDDLGKHPEAVAATIQAVRELQPRRLHVAYEPFMHDDVLRWRRRWAAVLGQADSVVVLPVERRQWFPVRRRAPHDWPTRAGLQADLATDRADAVEMLAARCRPGDIALVLGCVNDLAEVSRDLAARLRAAAVSA